MKVEPVKFERLLNMLLLPKAGNPFINPAIVDFTEEGLKVRITDTGIVVGVIADFKKEYFREYEAIGKVRLTNSMLTTLKNAFKVDEVIDVDFGETVRFKGKIEEYTEQASKSECEQIEEGKLKFIGGTAFLASSPPEKVYYLDATMLKGFSNEEVYFNYGENLEAIVKTEISKYRKTLAFEKQKGEGTGRTIIHIDYLDRVMSNLDGPVWLMFTKGPIVIAQKTKEFNISYIIAPKIVEVSG